MRSDAKNVMKGHRESPAGHMQWKQRQDTSTGIRTEGQDGIAHIRFQLRIAPIITNSCIQAIISGGWVGSAEKVAWLEHDRIGTHNDYSKYNNGIHASGPEKGLGFAVGSHRVSR
jgi:hypothetical protein